MSSLSVTEKSKSGNGRVDRRSSVKKKDKNVAHALNRQLDRLDISSCESLEVTNRRRSMSREDRARFKFSHSVYDKAAMMFDSLSDGKGVLTSSPTFETEFEKRRAYSLAFAAKKYEAILKDVLLDSSFYSRYFKLETYHHSNVMVMLLDFYEHGFRFSESKRLKISESNGVISHIDEIQKAFFDRKISLSSAFARNRIKACALTLDALLPPEVKESGECGARHPLYARVNTLLTDRNSVIERLQENGFNLCEQVIKNVEDEEKIENIFAVDEHFDDLLVFPACLKDDIYNNDLALDYHLIPQSKPRYVIFEALCSKLQELQMHRSKASQMVPGDMTSIMGEGDNVILTHPEFGSLSAHLCSCIHPSKKLIVYGCHGSKKEEIEKILRKMGARNFELVDESFTDVLPSDQIPSSAKVVICNPPCSKSGIVNPVDFILHEGSEAASLISKKITPVKVRGFIQQQKSTLKHALKLPNIDSVIYFTFSTNDEENNVVKSVLNDTQLANNNEKEGFQLANFLPSIVSALKSNTDNTLNKGSKELSLQPTSSMNGFHLAVIERKIKEESAREVLERASKKGLIKKPTQKKKITQKSPGSPKVARKSAKKSKSIKKLLIDDDDIDQRQFKF